MRTRTLRGLVTVAALLPWLTWVLPIYSFETDRFADEAVSLASAVDGGSVVRLFAPILVMVVLAGWAWLRRPGVVWAVLAGVVVGATSLLLIGLSQGVIMWDGVDDQGRPTGGTEFLGPDWGLGVMILSLALWVVSCVLVLIGRRKDRSAPPAGAVDHGSDTMAG